MLKDQILNIKRNAFEDIEKSKNARDVFALRVKYLGRKSEFNGVLKNLKNLPEKEKRIIGSLANRVKDELKEIFDAAEKKFRSIADFQAEKIDITIPAKKIKDGHLHPLSIVQNEVEDIFTAMGFEIVDGPEIETEWHNFDALNIPKDHPARDAWDTFFIKNQNSKIKIQNNSKKKLILRTHTSPVQIRYMQKNKPPFRIIASGRCFRHEATDATHEHTFHQFETLMVGDNINVGHLKHVAQQFFSCFFKKEIKVRFRPSYFPFTEPSFEFDIYCTICGGGGCSSCKQSGWLEMGGAGMVNQQVFVNVGYPRGKYTGFAWGFGLERLAMMKYKIDDIRLFHGGDLKFIEQF